MSLTSFLKSPSIKQLFKETFPIPKTSLNSPLLASPNTKNYSSVGTAFDYLLRFYIKQISPESIESEWVAEGSVDRIKMHSGKYALVDGNLESCDPNKEIEKQFPNAESMSYYKPSGKWEKAIKPSEKIILDAKSRYAKFIQTGKLEDELIESTLKLAQLDLVYRAEAIYIDDRISKQDVSDLRNLFGVAVRSNIFKKNQKNFLNPTFGKGSKLVVGADADLVIGDTLIDIKVTKDLNLKRDWYNQIIGYYALSTMENKPTKIKNVGIYFARHGVLHTIPIKDIGQKDDFDNVLVWFETLAEKLRKIN